ncbi:hypothetical protein FE257_011135 [Aspergillus nanangensis]|uniref:AB hydrolase-1 domain-containing protein n=1 Tax=Aspergillus nanangensis TaxID=2582783 RepID=A0AAD4CJ74_ASPNN|nr:hypothetical protein FE257_011135 [Aspergillus nanangensis]
MSTSIFDVKEHFVNAQHIREYPAATAERQEDVLQLALKQYVPRDNLSPKAGDFSIIGAHANGFPKELYEPLWEEIHHRLKAQGIAIRGIWIADVAHQGKSSMVNEQKLGNDPSSLDHARDLLLMINEFRDQLPRPIVGIGHSMGAVQLITLSLLHPRLLQSLVLIEPPMTPIPITSYALAIATASTFRKDRWSSRDAVRAAMPKNPYYRSWDPRVFDQWIEHGFRDTPTVLHPQPGAVTLATPKLQEVFTFLRPLYDVSRDVNKTAYPDLDPTTLAPDRTGYNAAADFVWRNLPALRPTALYIMGGASPLGASELEAMKLARTGMGVGGSGGAPSGKVGQVTIPGGGHLLPMETVDGTAEAIVEWLGQQVPVVRLSDEEFQKRWDGLTLMEKSRLDDRWNEIAGAFLAKMKESKLHSTTPQTKMM